MSAVHGCVIVPTRRETRQQLPVNHRWYSRAIRPATGPQNIHGSITLIKEKKGKLGTYVHLPTRLLTTAWTHNSR